MKLMVNPTITDFQQDVNGDIKMLKLGVDQEDAYANIIGQAETADLENNKATTINVSTYTQPVEVKPTAGKDGMKKATITLSNIPSGEITGVYGASTNGYQNGVLIITDSSDVGEIKDYTGYEQTFEAALADTEYWISANSTISTYLEGLDVEGAELSGVFGTITIDGELYNLSGLTSSFTSLSPYEP